MKTTFLILCISLCIFSWYLYANTMFDWTTIQTIVSRSIVSISFPISNLTIIPLMNKSTKRPKSTRPKLPPSQNRRFAIFACSIHPSLAAYTFYTPITAASWQRIGYDPIVVFVGDFKQPNVITPRLNLSRNYLKHVGAHIVDVQCNESYAIKLSQLVRVFSGFLPDDIVDDEDNILTGDSDLMPLKGSEYQPTPGADGFIFNAFCCGQFQRRSRSYTMFPSTCVMFFILVSFTFNCLRNFFILVGHIFLQKKAWRAMVIESQQRAELLNNTAIDQQTKDLLSENAPLSFEMITAYARHEFKDVYDQRMDKGDAAWYMDQVLCSMLLTDYQEKHPNFTINQRGRADRLDRAHPMNYWDRETFNEFGDAHLKHDEILEPGNWKIFNRLLKALFNETLVNLFNDYYKQYMIVQNPPPARPPGKRR